MSNMIEVEGFKAFRGKMRIVLDRGNTALLIQGDWLYKPDTKCWYNCGVSYPAECCEVFEIE